MPIPKIMHFIWVGKTIPDDRLRGKMFGKIPTGTQESQIRVPLEDSGKSWLGLAPKMIPDCSQNKNHLRLKVVFFWGWE